MLKEKQKTVETIDEYIAEFPKEIQTILTKIRLTVRKAAPQAAEAIKYGIPTYVLNGNLLHFAAYKNHIGLYPTSKAIVKFKKELSPYAGAKGTVRFPLDKPIPLGLISKIVKSRVKDNLTKVKAKKR
ncbi:MAG TPA: DUF1801 domain-containing protein [Pyrinomonadaceae bacterium]|nr:DUF1801 domain-containing protein [Pyrinomonadaceae bacterium]